MNSNIIVTKVLLQESMTYQPQYRRTFEARVDGRIETLIANRFKNLKGEVSTGALVAGVAEEFMMPSMQPDKQIAIAGNWARPMYRALINVTVRSVTGHDIAFVLTAHSDPIDPSIQGAFDVNKPFYITNIVQLRQFVDRTSGVSVPVTALASATQVMANNNFEGFNSKYDFRQRPMDVFSYIGQAALNLNTPQEDIYDERTILSNTPIKSEVRNQLPSVFVSKVLGAYKMANGSSGSIGGTQFDQLSEAQGLIMEQESAQDMFLAALRAQRKQGFDENVTNWFTLAELHALSPNDVTRSPKLVPLSRDVVNLRAQGPGQTWSYSKPLQRMASYLKDTVPALMMDNMLMRAHIHCSNRVFSDGRMMAHVKDWNTFADVDVTQNIQMLESRLVREVMMPLSEQNTLALDVDMLVMVDADSRFTISFNGSQGEEFVAPTFAGALLSPVLTSNAQAAFTMANEFKELGDMINDAATQMPTMKGAVFMGGGKRAF